MPADFNACVDAGGKVIAKSLSKDRYVRLCKDKNGNWHTGEVKKKLKVGKKKDGS